MEGRIVTVKGEHNTSINCNRSVIYLLWMVSCYVNLSVNCSSEIDLAVNVRVECNLLCSIDSRVVKPTWFVNLHVSDRTQLTG